ncbi:hypothetical protein B9Z19DRAFT_233372 [Tuber borchii]|uniref:Uncharacterized protein n=1 Tax=Tuber borchii TaxID=42251 RepID=A0A2T7A5K9_TUBBO|nr:hypothetical protein B9Z19DRAFT_233372 [Tuber borchii]
MTLLTCLYFLFFFFLPSFSLPVPTSMPNPVCPNCPAQNDAITHEGPEEPGKKRQAKQAVSTSRLLPTLLSLLEQWKSPFLFLDLPAVAGDGNSLSSASTLVGTYTSSRAVRPPTLSPPRVLYGTVTPLAYQ